eukprot:3402404-Pleurochrysis_carterae.AAC.1
MLVRGKWRENASRAKDTSDWRGAAAQTGRERAIPLAESQDVVRNVTTERLKGEHWREGLMTGNGMMHTRGKR